jgi:hypothetical protein
MAKAAVRDGEVKVNGETCLQRGRKLRAGTRPNLPAGSSALKRSRRVRMEIKSLSLRRFPQLRST